MEYFCTVTRAQTASFSESTSKIKVVLFCTLFSSSYLAFCSYLTFKICCKISSEAATKCVQWKKVFLEISQNLQENTYARVTFLMKCLWHRCFPVNFAKFLRTPVLENISGRLLLYLLSYKSHRLYQPKFWKALTMFYSTKDNKNSNSPTANFVFTGCWIVRLFLLLKSDNFPMAIYMAS